MSENRYFIISSCLKVSYAAKVNSTTVKRERFLFFKYNVTYSKSITEPRRKYLPLLLYGDGEDFFEFFTKGYFGSREPYPYDKYIRGSGIYIPHPSIETVDHVREEWGPDSTWSKIEEISASKFLKEVSEIKAEFAKDGVEEKELVNLMRSKVCPRAYVDKEERERRKRLAEEEKKRKALEAEQQRIREEEMARKALEEMLK